MRATLQQIATAAQVSISTASRALNGHPAISTATIDLVRQAAEGLQYKRRRSHRRMDVRLSLAGARIGILSLGMDRSLLTLPVIASAISGAEASLAEAGAIAQLVQIPDPRKPPPGLVPRHLDGAVLLGALQGTMVADAAASGMAGVRELPSVWVVGRPAGCWGDAVVSADYSTGSRAAHYLVERGHKRLAFINPKPDHILFLRREDGFVAACRRLGVEVLCLSKADPLSASLPTPVPTNVQLMQELVDQLLACRPRPTAIMAAADSVATLVYRACAVRGLRVGEDISVISGNNDAALVAGLHPHLTTFDVHAYRLGQLAVRQLALRLSHPGPHPETEQMLEPTLHEGDSVAHLQRPRRTRK